MNENAQEYSNRIRDERLNAFLKSPLVELVRWAHQAGYSYADQCLEQLNAIAREELGETIVFKSNVWSGGTFTSLERKGE